MVRDAREWSLVHRGAALGAALLFVGAAASQVPPQAPAWLPAEYRYDRAYFEGATYDPALPAPRELLGFEIGERPATHAEMERCLKAWAGAAPKRMTLTPYAQTDERRTLYYAVITSEKNHARLDAIRAAIGKLADPRRLKDDAEAQQIIRQTPAIAWMAYSIHGDELSGADAALAVAYHLVASRDAEVGTLLDELVVMLDPMMNPDGRDRFIRQTDEVKGYTPNLDVESQQHGGRWPWGRTNHYHADLNRDWILGVHPETRGRRAAIVQWNPQLLVDGHEMGAHDTYLFYPPREPFNPNIAPLLHKWWKTFADEQGRAFDRFGWSYYTREWADFWYPGYSDGWGALQGAVAILYEQAGTGGSPIVQASGSILTYRESVHHHVVSTMANLQTLRANRGAILSDFLESKRDALAGDEDDRPQTFLLPPSDNATRMRAFLDNLHNQGIEIDITQQASAAGPLRDALGNAYESRDLPAGTYVIQRRQPRGALVGALLDFDPRMSTEFLNSERKELETKRQTRIYDITGWCLPMAYGLEAYWSRAAVEVPCRPYEGGTGILPVLQPDRTRSVPATGETPLPPRTGETPVPPTENPYAWVIDAGDDAWQRATAFLLQAGATCRVAEKEFRVAGRTFRPGSLLIRRHENGPELAQRLQQAAEASGATIYAAATARSPDDAPDLGGQHFLLLRRPRVALLSDFPTSAYVQGAIWRLFDVEVGLSLSLAGAVERGIDLRRYNVLIVPSTWGAAERMLEPSSGEVKTWVESGGTLIAIGDSAAYFTKPDRKWSEVRLRPDVLDKLSEYATAAALERAARTPKVESGKVWDETVEAVPAGVKIEPPPGELKDKALDEWRSIFSPVGVIVRGEVNVEHWLAFGCPPELPLHAAGAEVFLSKHPVQTAVRFAAAKRLRLSGLLWPEAAERLGDSAYVTVERIGRGQLILFAQDPDFRGAWHGTRRLLVNAVLLGPGCGASAPMP